MQVLSVRVGLTKNLGNYESLKLEVEASPENGQNIDQFLEQVNGFLSEQVASGIEAAGGVKEKPAKKEKPSTTTPLAKTAAPDVEKPAEKPAKETKPAKAATKPKVAEGTEKEEKPAKPSKANVNKPDHKVELKYALESETLDELLERFNGVRKMAPEFGDKWEDAVTKIADRYRKLNSLDANPETLDAIVKAFKAERTAIEKMKSEQAA